ncbi:hypothetical protein ACFX2K_020435 [Malus domestica]
MRTHCCLRTSRYVDVPCRGKDDEMVMCHAEDKTKLGCCFHCFEERVKQKLLHCCCYLLHSLHEGCCKGRLMLRLGRIVDEGVRQRLTDMVQELCQSARLKQALLGEWTELASSVMTCMLIVDDDLTL